MDYTKEELSNLITSWSDENEYRKGSGKKFLSQSDVGPLLHNPKEFRDVKDRPLLAFLHGSYYHEKILEPEKAAKYVIVDASTRSTNIYKQAIQETGAEILLLKKEQEMLDNLVEATLANKVVRSLIRAEGNIIEKPGTVKINGEWFKGRADIVCPSQGMIIDLKTSTDVDTKFKYKAKTYHYDAQAFIYNQIFGLDFVFIVCDKNNGNLGVFETSDSFLQSGQLKVERAVEVYKKYYKGKTPEETRALLNDRLIHQELF